MIKSSQNNFNLKDELPFAGVIIFMRERFKPNQGVSDNNDDEDDDVPFVNQGGACD